MIKCWTCQKFATVFLKKKPVLDCGYSISAKYTRLDGFVHNGCPEYEREPHLTAEDSTVKPEDNQI